LHKAIHVLRRELAPSSGNLLNNFAIPLSSESSAEGSGLSTEIHRIPARTHDYTLLGNMFVEFRAAHGETRDKFETDRIKAAVLRDGGSAPESDQGCAGPNRIARQLARPIRRRSRLPWYVPGFPPGFSTPENDALIRK
jgi:hypothetical protein